MLGLIINDYVTVIDDYVIVVTVKNSEDDEEEAEEEEEVEIKERRSKKKHDAGNCYNHLSLYVFMSIFLCNHK